MTEGFANPIIGGGGSLVYPSIHSPGFSAGPPIVGWSIDKNGDAYFSGTFGGNNYEITSAGAFFYSGTPAAGNLIASTASGAGTDPYGNAYVAGIAVYGASGQTIQLEESAGTAFLNFLSGATSESKPAQITETISGSGAGEQVYFRVFGPQSTATSNDRVEFFMFDSPAGSPGRAGLIIDYITGSFSFGAISVDALGGHLYGTVTATAPGTSGSTLVPESWNAPTLNAGWQLGSNDGTAQPFAYRMEPDGLVHLLGSIHSTSSSPSSTFFTIPSGYRPSVNQRVGIVEATATQAFANFAGISTSGAVSPFLVTTSSGTDYHFDATYRVS